MLERIVIFIFGSIVGSFLNVCIHRLPLNESIVWPGSHCPQCNKPIPWYLNIPLVSYLALLGKCRYCKKPIAFRYFLVELLTALTFLVFFMRYELQFEFFFYSLFVCGLIISTFVDIQHRIIPDEISVGGMIAGFALVVLKTAWSGFQTAGLRPAQWGWSPALDSLAGIIVGGGVIYATGFLFDLVYFKLLKKPPIQGETESMGGGDVKLLAMIGAFLGWQNALLTFFLAPFFGLIVGAANMLIKKDHTIPYGPFLSLAAVIALFWGPIIIRPFIYLPCPY
jgi:leader peptidase (prepilin peptidase)/N-methyltransferase